MESDDENAAKKETGFLFYNLNIKKNQIGISSEIKIRNNKIKNMREEMNSEIEKSYSSQDKYMKSNLKYFKMYWSQFLFPKTDNKPKKPKKKKINLLSSKIYFGSFFNQNSQFDITENDRKYDKIKKVLSRSSNFSFIKDPKTIKFDKLPNYLYLSKEDSIKIRGLVSVKNINTEINNKRKIALKNKFLKDNLLLEENKFCTYIKSDEEDENEEIKEELKKKIEKIQNNNVFYLKNRKNNNSSSTFYKKFHSQSNSSKSILSTILKSNSVDFIKTEEKEESENSKNLTKKNKSYSKLSTKIYPKLEKINTSYLNIHNNTYNQQFYSTQKNFLYKKIKEKLDEISEYKTPIRDIKELSNLSKLKCKKKMKKIKNLIKKSTEYKSDPKALIRLLRENKDKKNKKKSRNQFYYDIRNQLRLLSIIDNLKNVKGNAPLTLMKGLDKDYQEKSKEMIVDDKITKKINNIYKSSNQGRIINEKISDKSQFINKFISKNKMESVKLKNKYEKFDLVVEEINEEKDVNKNPKMLTWIYKIKNMKKMK